MKTLTIFVNDEAVHEYDCDTPLSDEQQAFLERMDKDMDRGVKMQGEQISAPDAYLRAEFVALNLIRALGQENVATVSVSCAYLCNRLPGLQEVHVHRQDDGLKLEWVEAGRGEDLS